MAGRRGSGSGQPGLRGACGFAQLRGLSLGDEITLTLRDLPEAYFGYIISDFQDSWDTYATQSVTLQIVGIYGTLSPNPVQMSYTSNYLYIPDSVMPDGFGVGDGSVYDSSFSFLLRSPADKDAFLTETRPALLDLGLDVQFIERDWETFAAASDALKDSALSGLLLYGALFLTVAAVCAFVYVHQRTKEIAIARALGHGRRGDALGELCTLRPAGGSWHSGLGSYFARRIAWGQILPKLEEISRLSRWWAPPLDAPRTFGGFACCWWRRFRYSWDFATAQDGVCWRSCRAAPWRPPG